jgi:ribonucleoside-diphosphate reductase beta chain
MNPHIRRAEEAKRLLSEPLLVEAFDNLANTNTNSLEEKRKLVLFCVLAMYILESINFPASFAVTFAITERGWFQGISQDVVLIARDESLHARAGAVVLNIVKKQWPETFEALKPQLRSMLQSVVEDEYAWADHLFSNGRQVIGLNAQLLKDYVDYCAMPVAATLGIEPLKVVKELPLPYMKDYLDSSRVQVANQELQNAAYLVNAVKSVSDEEMDVCLASLKERYLYGN